MGFNTQSARTRVPQTFGQRRSRQVRFAIFVFVFVFVFSFVFVLLLWSKTKLTMCCLIFGFSLLYVAFVFLFNVCIISTRNPFSYFQAKGCSLQMVLEASAEK